MNDNWGGGGVDATQIIDGSHQNAIGCNDKKGRKLKNILDEEINPR